MTEYVWKNLKICFEKERERGRVRGCGVCEGERIKEKFKTNYITYDEIDQFCKKNVQ